MQLTYNDHTIDQRDDNYVNLSQMAKANRVRLSAYLQSVETQNYLKAAQESNRPESCLLTELVQTTGFGKNKATWGHPLVALHLGQWISPEFHVWCNQNIHTLIATGTANLNPDTTRLEQALLQTQQQLSQLTGLVTTLATGSKPTATKQKTLKADLNHPNPEIKEILTRTKVRKLINSYCYLTNQNYRNVYQHLYEQYKLRYNYDVYAECAKNKQTCKLTQMEQDDQLDRFHQMVTALTLEQAA